MAKISNAINGNGTGSPPTDHVGRTHLSSTFENQAQKLEQQISGLSDELGKKLDQRRDFIQKNPLKSVAIAAAGGILVGGIAALIARRK